MSKPTLESRLSPKVLDAIEELEMFACRSLDDLLEDTDGSFQSTDSFEVVGCPVNQYPQLAWDNLMARGLVLSVERVGKTLSITWSAAKVKEYSDHLLSIFDKTDS